MTNNKEFHGLDLNVKEISICRDNPVLAIQMYRKRTGLGIKDAKDALEQELGMDCSTYRRVRDRVAFSFFYMNWLIRNITCGDSNLDFKVALVEWRKLRRMDHPMSKQNSLHDFYKKAESILNLSDRDLYDEEDARDSELEKLRISKMGLYQ